MADIEYQFGDSFVGADVCLFVAGGFVVVRSYFIFSFDPMMKIVLIGAGNVATHLGIALQKAGCLILQVYSRTEESASALADRLLVDYTIVQILYLIHFCLFV
jgi:thioredoxin reductase